MTNVWVAPGHGLRPNGTYDPGAMDGQKSEQTEGNIVAGHLTGFLKDLGFSVYRQPLGGPNFVGSIDDINRQNPDLAIALHHDWIKAPRGGFGFWIHERHLKLANLIHAEYQNAKLPTRSHMKYLPGTKVPPAIMSRTRPFTILWEIDRIGSVVDHERYAVSIGRGIARYFNVPILKPTPVDVKKPTPVVEPKPPRPTPKSKTWTETLVENLPVVKRRTNLRTSSAWDRRVQGLLVANGIAPRNTIDRNGRLDGKFGPGTEAAVRSFQRSKKVRGGVDGIVGRHTWTALLGR